MDYTQIIGPAQRSAPYPPSVSGRSGRADAAFGLRGGCCVKRTILIECQGKRKIQQHAAEAAKGSDMAEQEKKEGEAAEKTEGASKRKKINRLSLAEIEAKIEQLKTTPGGMKTRYAQHLLRRAAVLKT